MAIEENILLSVQMIYFDLETKTILRIIYLYPHDVKTYKATSIPALKKHSMLMKGNT